MLKILAAFLLVLVLSGCAETQFASHVIKRAAPPSQNEGTFKVGKPYKVEGTWYYPKEQYEYSETGLASWYGPGFHGKRTANGEQFDTGELTAAHRTLQMPSLVRVTNLSNGKSLIVRVNDRGPYKRGRVMDVSSKAAELLGFKNIGTAKVRLDLLPQESMQIAAAARSGLSTKGYEIAANQGTYAIQSGAVYADSQPVGLQDYPVAENTRGVRQETVQDIAGAPNGTGITPVVPGHTRYGQFYPDPIVTEQPVHPTGIYIQAGSFSNQSNADNLRARLQSYGNSLVRSVTVNGRQYYRVRIGPVASVAAADALLNRVVAGGQKEAVIVVE